MSGHALLNLLNIFADFLYLRNLLTHTVNIYYKRLTMLKAFKFLL